MHALVIVPTYNERENLPVLVRQLLDLPHVGVLVVDDGSPDGTADEADRLARESGARLNVIRRRGPRGLGRSYIEAMQRAIATGAAFICQMDADLSHDPLDIPRLLDRAGAADLVIGSRYVAGGRLENWPLHRVALSTFANWYVRVVTGIPVRDCTSGFRCWRRELLARLPLHRIVAEGYAFQVELLWEAHVAGARIAEMPITFVERRFGTSKLTGGVIAESAILPWRLAARKRRLPGDV